MTSARPSGVRHFLKVIMKTARMSPHTNTVITTPMISPTLSCFGGSALGVADGSGMLIISRLVMV